MALPPDPSRIWRVGQTTWRDTDIPYAAGTDDYYREIAKRTAAAKGETGPQKSDDLKLLERQLAADKLALPEWQQEQEWKDAHNETLRRYAEAQNAYLASQAQWEKDIIDLARQRDQTGKLNAAYVQVDDPVLGATYKAVDGFFTGLGKMGGAGNANPAAGIDNRWNPVEDGLDVRTDEQKFYDRELKGIDQVADAEGHYNWYGNEDYIDGKGQKQTRRVNLSELAFRQSSPDDVDPGKGAGGSFAKDQFWLYNQNDGYGIREADYWNAVKNRKNLSTYGRTA